MRICKRLTRLWKHADTYRQCRTKWVFFNRWLKFIERETVSASFGLIPRLKRRKELMLKYSQYLESRDFKKLPYVNNYRLLMESAQQHATFYRILMYTQETQIFRQLEVLAARHARVLLLSKCFLVLKTNMRLEDVLKLQFSNPPSEQVRIESDVQHYIKRTTAIRKRSIFYIIRYYSRRVVFANRMEALDMVTYKSFVSALKSNISSRLVTEQRILVDAFSLRGRLEYRDVRAPPEVSASMG